MKDLLKKAEDLYDLLCKKNEEADKKLADIKKRENDLECLSKSSNARANDLSARERIIKKYEAFDREVEDLKSKKKECSYAENENSRKEKELGLLQEGLLKKEEEIESMRELFKTKNKNMDDLKKKLEEDKKKMREKVLEEIKGKL